MIYATFNPDGSMSGLHESTVDFDVNDLPETAFVVPQSSWDWFVSNSVLTPKFSHSLTLPQPQEVVADGVAEYVISNIPNPCDVTWPDGVVTTVTDGEVTFSVDLEGEYTFKFNSIPHIIEDVTIEAIPSP